MVCILKDPKALGKLQYTHFQYIARVLWTRPMSTLGPKCVLKESLQGMDMAILGHQFHFRICPFHPNHGTSLARFNTPCHLLPRPRHPIHFQAHPEVEDGPRCWPLKVGPLHIRGGLEKALDFFGTIHQPKPRAARFFPPRQGLA